MIKKLLLFFICSSFCLSMNAQDLIKELDVYSFGITDGKDTIDFININTDLINAKPTIIFCQGSLPIPLIIEFEDGKKVITGINNFDYKKIAETYNLILISNPHIPVIANEGDLNYQYAYITDKDDPFSYPQDYLNSNYLERYVERGNKVIEFLLRQDWVDNKRIYIAGHSQGAKVAAKIASENNRIAALGFLSGNPLGRIDQFVRQSRLSELKDELSPEKAQEEINKTYDWWKWVNEYADAPSQKGEDSPRTIISFSTPVLPDLLKITAPVYIAYGTKDIAASYCDLLPVDFIRAGKMNYESVPYLGLEHNFMEVDAAGKPIPEKCYWNEVMTGFVNWIERME